MKLSTLSFLFLGILVYSLLSCTKENPPEINALCYQSSGLIRWEINGQKQSPNISIEPNTGVNGDAVFHIDKRGSWAIFLTNEVYSVSFSDFDDLILPKEYEKLTEKEWEKLLTSRSEYAFEFDPKSKQQLGIWDGVRYTFVGDKKEEVVGGQVNITFRSTSLCKYLVLEVNAHLVHENVPYYVNVVVEDPYLFP